MVCKGIQDFCKNFCRYSYQNFSRVRRMKKFRTASLCLFLSLAPSNSSIKKANKPRRDRRRNEKSKKSKQMENKMQTLDLFTATAANANLFNEENKAQKAHTRSTLGSTIKMNVMQAMDKIERQFGKCFFEMVDEDEKSIDIIFRDINNRYREFYTCNRQTYVIYNIK